MAGDQSACLSQLELDPSDPQFPQKAVASNSEMRRELREAIAATRKTIDRSKAAIAEADRILGNKR
jgi:hypothetical protein